LKTQEIQTSEIFVWLRSSI